ncbi:arylamine N-acetyltransferase [Brevibacillus sp. SYSU BS000544]|uniref:arylamine N-acetyltransferase n=1 Tax=Brevibacillus sp. SYSU BS000544 TaxID=3416443 RepID=UPI003CE5258B
MNWTDRYLKLLNVEHSLPTYDFLQELMEAHLHVVPFEIVSKYHYFSSREPHDLIPTKEEFLDNAIQRGWGGNCYILNIHFGELLRTLGFDTNYVRAVGGNAHLASMVTIDANRYYVDVGYMAPLFEPVQLEKEPHLARCGEEIIINRRSDHEYIIDRRTGGQSFVMKTIEWFPVERETFVDDIIHAHRDEDENPFMRRIIATRFNNRVCYQVINSKLLIKSDTDIQAKEYTNKEEWLDMMQSHFSFDERDLAFALDFLAKRKVELFSN